jgi:hypothetical protein
MSLVLVCWKVGSTRVTNIAYARRRAYIAYTEAAMSYRGVFMTYAKGATHDQRWLNWLLRNLSCSASTRAYKLIMHNRLPM